MGPVVPAGATVVGVTALVGTAPLAPGPRAPFAGVLGKPAVFDTLPGAVVWASAELLSASPSRAAPSKLYVFIGVISN
jgi:hypothetical protein